MVQISILRFRLKSSPDLPPRPKPAHVLPDLSSGLQEPLQNDRRRVVIVRLRRNLHGHREEPPPSSGWMLGKVPAPGQECGVPFLDKGNGDARQLDRQMLADL